MGKMFSGKHPCLDPKCGSSDARRIYEDDSSYCFSCQTLFPAERGEWQRAETRVDGNKDEDVKKQIKRIKAYNQAPAKYKELPGRFISAEVCEFFGVRTSHDEDGKIDTHYYPYDNEAAFKLRYVKHKNFDWKGKSDSLFGYEKFNGGGKRIIITEGEIDALTVAEASVERYDGKIYPVCALSASSMAEKSLIKHREWLRTFDEIILWFDNDEPGEKARQQAIKILGQDKVKLVKNQFKDANETWGKDGKIVGGAKAVMSAIFDAAPYIPSGIISDEEVWKRVVEKQSIVSIPYPPCARGLNARTKGFRGGQITTFISGTGSGKSTLMKEIALHLRGYQDAYERLVEEKNAQNTKENEEMPDDFQIPMITPYRIKIGMINLEEPPGETGEKMAAMVLKKNPVDTYISLRELKSGFDQIFSDNRIQLLDHQGAMKDASLIDKLEYLVLSGCTHLIIDHITILVSEGSEGLTGNEAIDKTMNDLLGITMRHPHVWIGLVSHLRKTSTGKPFEEGQMPTMDDIKGSGSIKQISFDIIGFCRDMMADSEDEKNEIQLAVLKCRFTGLTGSVIGSKYDHKTGRLVYLEDAANSNDEFQIEPDTGEVIEKPAASAEPREEPKKVVEIKTPLQPAIKAPTTKPLAPPKLRAPAAVGF